MSDITQAGRLLSIKSHLPEDTLILQSLTVTEALSQPFLIEAEMISNEIDLEAADMIGKPVTCIIHGEDGEPRRHFSGIIRSFGKVGGLAGIAAGRGYFGYRLEAVPQLWQLTRTSDCRIFQKMSVLDILTQILSEGDVSPVTYTVESASEQRPYVTQFNETDFAFVRRLINEVGGCYFFRCEAVNEVETVITDDKASFHLLDVELVRRGTFDRPDAVINWHSTTAMQPGAQMAQDYDNERPKSLLNAQSQTRLDHSDPSGDRWQRYAWPGTQAFQPEQDAAKLAMERYEAEATQRRASTQTPELYAGSKVKIKPALDGSAKAWLVTAVRHDAFDRTHTTHSGEATGYTNSVTLIPEDVAWRNPHVTPRPLMAGLQSAIVTGPEGEEIHTDELGRVQILFHWDRGWRKEKSGTTSCFVRVAQPIAGAWGGTFFLPRIGDEVLVAFLEGDPDRPVIVGSLYNATAMPPWSMPDEKTVNGIMTRSSKGGGKERSNVIKLDDAVGREKFLMNASKYMAVHVEYELFTHVHGFEVRKVSGDGQFKGGGTRDTDITSDETLRVGGNRKDTIEKNDTQIVQGARTTTVSGKETLTIEKGDRETTLKMGNDTTTLKMGDRTTELTLGNDTLNIKLGNLTITCSLGNIDIKASVGTITLDALQGITLKSGPVSKVEITPDGVSVKGLKISNEAQLLHEDKGAIKQHVGQGMSKFGAAMTMIGG